MTITRYGEAGFALLAEAVRARRPQGATARLAEGQVRRRHAGTLTQVLAAREHYRSALEINLNGQASQRELEALK